MSAANLEIIDEKLAAQGWFLSPEGLEQITQNGNLKDLRAITQNALDSDLKEIGKAVLAEQIAKKLVNNVVLQIQKMKNISAPKANEDSQAAPRMLKLNLTDGHAHCQAVEIDNVGGLNLHKTAPGTKLLLKNAPVLNGFLFLKPEMAIVLGGKVAQLYEKWELNKNMSNVKRGASDTDGPPAWVNFGRKIAGSETKDFKSLEDKTTKEDGKPTEFEVQRNVAIAEATTGAVKKVFGGGMKPLMSEKFDSYGNRRDREVREPRENRDRPAKPERRNKRELKGGKDDVLQAKPSEKVSLFDFLEDKLPEQVAQPVVPPKPYNNYNQRPNTNKPERYERFDKGERFEKNDRGPSDRRQEKGEKSYQKSYSAGDYSNQRQPNHYQNEYKSDYKSSASYSRDREQNRRGNQPPRLQNKPVPQPAQPSYNQASNQAQYQQFPPVQTFQPTTQPPPGAASVDDLANKMDRLNVNASFAKNAFKQHLNLTPSNAPKSSSELANSSSFGDGVAATAAWKWNIGDLCMAKYWEDNKYYNATITGLTAKTCVVRFNEYGNMEEVLLEDCLPISAEDADSNPARKGGRVSNGNEYRGNRNFVNRNRRH